MASRAERYIKKHEHMFFGDPSIVAQRRFLDGEISEAEYELVCRVELNIFYTSLLKRCLLI